MEDEAASQRRLAAKTRNRDDEFWHNGCAEGISNYIEGVKSLEDRAKGKGLVPKAIASRNLWIGIAVGTTTGAVLFNVLFQWLLKII